MPDRRGVLAAALLVVAAGAAHAATLRGRVVDAESGAAIPARVYIQDSAGRWFFARSAVAEGSAVEYRKQRGEGGASVEMHTTLSAHPFTAELKPGEYTVIVERGKEYHPLKRKVTVGNADEEHRFELRRWIDMAGRGWYSGDTHVHRTLKELPNVALAEDLNVSLPLVYWVTRAFQSPASSERTGEESAEPRLIEIDREHVVYPRNTEYEIFTVEGQRHTLGAVFLLNHRSVIRRGVPPVAEVARQAHAEGALLELDKHNWPWSMAIVPVMQVDLFELSNNHVWRTAFYFRKFGEQPPDYMGVEQNAEGMTERGWLDFGFQNYYALLNCGFHLRPTAGTASGVHPVPLGFGRVYVHLPEGFRYEAWVKGLDRGRSFVTTGPMLFAQINGQDPGHTFPVDQQRSTGYRVTGTVESPTPLERIEIVAAGRVVGSIGPANKKTPAGSYVSSLDKRLPQLKASSWVAVRCFAKQPDGRLRFAHTAPWHFDWPGRPLRPRQAEVQYLIRRVQEQIERSRDTLPEAALVEYRQALRVYQEIAERARAK